MRTPYSETQGRRRGLAIKDFNRLLYEKLDQLDEEFVFAEFGDPSGMTLVRDDGSVHRGGAQDPVVFFLERVRSVGPWWWLVNRSSDEHRRRPPRSIDEALDFVQALHEIAAITTGEDDEDLDLARTRGQERMRELVNPVLGLLEPPLQLAVDGTIVRRLPTALEPLIEHPLPDDVATEDIAEDVRDAIAQFRRRDATDADRHSACVRLAGVLERLRESSETQQALFSADEARLFEIANQFGLRHRDRNQRTDYEQGPFLEWVFYCQLAAIRLAARLRPRGGS